MQRQMQKGLSRPSSGEARQLAGAMEGRETSVTHGDT